MKTVYLHIGLGRCGTTSIQRTLFSARHSLEDAGYLYIQTDPGGEAHHSLCPLKKELLPSAKAGWEIIAKDFLAMRQENLIISSENMIGIADELIYYIKDLFRKQSVKILFIGRSQSGLLPSTFSQWTKAGILFESFPSFFKATHQLWHFESILDRWEKHFGRQNINCRVIQRGEDAVEKFLTFFPESKLYKILNSSSRERLNSSLSSELLKLIFLYDIANTDKLPVWHEFPGWELIEPPIEILYNSRRLEYLKEIERLSKLLHSPCEKLLTHDDEKMINSTYFESNQLFHMNHLGKQSTDWLNA